MISAYKEYWKGYVDFTGTTSRPGYWWAFLANYLMSLVVSLVSGILNGLNRNVNNVAAVPIAFMLLCMLPSLAIMVRRLRDAGYDWGNVFWLLLPIAGPIILIVKMCKPTKDGAYRPVQQQVSASGAPVYNTYAQAQPQPQAYTPAPAAPAPPPPARPNILAKYRDGLGFLDSCGDFDEGKFREFNRIVGNRFSEADIRQQLDNGRMLGSMNEIKKLLRSSTVEAIETFEQLERDGIDLSKFNI